VSRDYSNRDTRVLIFLLADMKNDPNSAFDRCTLSPGCTLNVGSGSTCCQSCPLSSLKTPRPEALTEMSSIFASSALSSVPVGDFCSFRIFPGGRPIACSGVNSAGAGVLAATDLAGAAGREDSLAGVFAPGAVVAPGAPATAGLRCANEANSRSKQASRSLSPAIFGQLSKPVPVGPAAHAYPPSSAPNNMTLRRFDTALESLEKMFGGTAGAVHVL
jgi:hypothetical protein